ncbi:TIGR01777 family oxidoreductase [Ekhidna sp. MALMAid0563]|uniref:TIGR01777 family oxidoreductase n=1 Tax=Ekhidna sp. MALMAid0563 TaxID=3143937 RepID=UPI0032DFEB4B
MSSTKLNDPVKTVLITGGSGLVGTELSQLLTSAGYKVTHLSRNPTQKHYQTFYWDVKKGEINDEAIISADAIIHLAGAGVSDKRWSDAWKKEIYDSRINSTKLLREKVEKLNPGLKHFISASAIGYYGWDTGDKLVDESTEKGEGFLADVVADWEKEVDRFNSLNIKTSKVRIGIVLSEKGGALVEMAKPIRFGVGAPLGSGNQYMSWIHINDLCGIFAHVLQNAEAGTFNGVAPNPETNKLFTKSVASQLGKPLWLPNVPKFALRLIVGEMSDILVGGNRVSSKKIEEAGFNFQFAALDDALEDLLQ